MRGKAVLIRIWVGLASVALGYWLVRSGRREPRGYGAVLLLCWLCLRLVLFVLPSPLLQLVSLSLLGQLAGVAVARRV